MIKAETFDSLDFSKFALDSAPIEPFSDFATAGWSAPAFYIMAPLAVFESLVITEFPPFSTVAVAKDPIS